MSGTSGPVSRLERARLDILQLKLDEAEDLWHAVDSALAISATSLGVARVGIWVFTGDGGSLYRARLHADGDDIANDDLVLPLDRWPRYRSAVVSRRVVAVSDARSDPQTSELRGDYLDRLGITSMLDVPLFLTGTVHGIVCHEHVGPVRTWTAREIDFATSVADMLSALLEQAMRLSAERRLRNVEATEARARQISAVARTAAGIAHDVNTVLQSISANAAVAGSDPTRRDEALRAILEDCQRSARILGQLRELDDRRAGIADAVRVADVVDGLRPTLEALVGAARPVVLHLDDRGHVAATRTDVERIVLNLVANARDAADEGSITVSLERHGDELVLAVEDEGPGVDPEQLPHVFEPYYSTKDHPHGGLGLFVVQVIAARSGGTVSVATRPTGGARFTVAWPAA